MSVFGQIAKTIDPDIKVELDFPSKNNDKIMPILDMKIPMDGQQSVKYKFYKKQEANKYCMLANSAVSQRVKRATLTNEAKRRLLCCSEEDDRTEAMEDSARMLWRSG